MKVIVLGTGAIGAYYGAQLARAGHAVTCFARGANLGAIQERGLEVRTPEGGFRAPVTATDRAEELAPADFAILAVKSYSLVDIAPIVRRCAEQETTVVPLLNGVETVQRLEQLGVPPAAVIGGLTAISAVRIAPGVVERRSPFQIVVVGEPDGRTSDRVDRIAGAFRNAGMDARASDRIQVELWQKFVFLAALAHRAAARRSAGTAPAAARNRGNRCRGARTRHRPPRGGGRARARRDRWPAAGDEAQLPGRPRDRRADGARHSQRSGFPLRGRGGYRHADPRHGGGRARSHHLMSSTRSPPAIPPGRTT